MKPVSLRLTPDGHRISEREIHRGLRINILAGCLAMFFFPMTVGGFPLTMILECLGANATLIGLSVAVQQVATSMQIPGAFLTERLKARKMWWFVLTITHRALWFVPALLPLLFAPERHAHLMAWIIVGVVATSSLLTHAGAAAWYSWMADLVPAQRRGRFWGTRQSVVMTASIAATLLTGYLLDRYPDTRHGGDLFGFSLVFGIGALLGCLDILLFSLVPEPRPHPPAKGRDWVDRLLDPLRNRDFRMLTLAMGSWSFALGLVGFSGVIYLTRAFHATYEHLAYTATVGALGAVLAGTLGGQLIDRIGPRAAGAIAFVAMPFVMLVWYFVKAGEHNFPELCAGVPLFGTLTEGAVRILPERLEEAFRSFRLPQAVWLILFANIPSGFFCSIPGLCQLHLSSGLAPRQGQTVAMGVHWTLVGLMGALGPLVGGLVVDWSGSHPERMGWALPTGSLFAFHHILVGLFGLVCWCAALPLLLGVSRRAGDIPVGAAVLRLLEVNPLRLAKIYTIAAPVGSRRRAKAVRTLGADRSLIAVSDLIRRLDDASADVREEAAFALGSIGSPEAVDALVEKLEDPESDLAPQIARALRSGRDPRSVEALVRRLETPDRETQSESARTLGEIGDPRAAPSLLQLLHQTRDSKVTVSSSEALARLGEIAAIYEILPRMSETRNPVLQRSLAVAVGDLLGEREGLYKALAREEAEAESGFASEAARLRKSLRALDGAALARERQTLLDLLVRAETSYGEERFDECVESLYRLGVGVAALRYGISHGGDAKALVDDLVWRDQRFGVAIWTLDFLRGHQQGEEEAAPGPIESLLAIHILASRSEDPVVPGSPSAGIR